MSHELVPRCHFCKQIMFEPSMGIGHPWCELKAAKEARQEYHTGLQMRDLLEEAERPLREVLP